MALHVSFSYNSAEDYDPLYEYSRSSFMGDRPVTRPLPKQRNTIVDKNVYRFHDMDWNLQFHRSSEDATRFRPRGHCKRAY